MGRLSAARPAERAAAPHRLVPPTTGQGAPELSPSAACGARAEGIKNRISPKTMDVKDLSYKTEPGT
jgi:hypothetical protein